MADGEDQGAPSSTPTSELAQAPLPRRGLFGLLTDLLYGYDVFISYTRRDDPESSYASALYVALEELHVRPFLDVHEIERDQPLNAGIASKVRASRMLVVLAGAAAGERPAVLAEVGLALELRKRIMILDRGIGWESSANKLRKIFPEHLATPAAETLPSDETIKLIRKHVGRWRVNLVRRWLIILAFATVLSLACVSFTLYRSELKANTEAKRQRDIAQQRAISEAKANEEAKKQRAIAEERTNKEKMARRDAESVIDFLRVDVRKALEPVGRLDLMLGISKMVADYHARNSSTTGKVDGLIDHYNEAVANGDQLTKMGQLAEAKQSFAAARTFALQAQDAGADPAWRDMVARTDVALGQVEQRMPNGMDEARTHYDDATQICGELWKSDADGHSWLANWVSAQAGLATLKMDQGNPQGALPILTSLDDLLAQKLAKEPGAILAHDRVVLLQNLCDCCRALGDSVGRIGAAQRAVDVAEPFAHGSDRDWQESAARARSFLADAYRDAGDHEKACKLYGQVFSQISTMANSDKQNAVWQELATTSGLSLGRECFECGRLDEAIDAYREVQQFAERGWEAGMTDIQSLAYCLDAERDLSRTLFNRAHLDDIEEAQKYLQLGRERAASLSKMAAPDDKSSQKALELFKEFDDQANQPPPPHHSRYSPHKLR